VSQLRDAGSEPELLRRGPAGRTLVFIFPMPLNLANARLHWRVKHNARVAYFATLDQLQAAKEIHPPPPQPFAKGRVYSTMTLGNRMDHDNAMARHKWILDWLQSRGYVANDKHLDWPQMPGQYISRREPSRIVLTLTETGP
jgi:hypothetical protein